MLPLRSRAVPLLCVFIGAPVTAEFLQAYLSFTGNPWASFGAIAFFAPLYGGAALLIREAAVRTARGWSGVILLAVAFGFAMPGVIDLSLFGVDRPDVAYWTEMREPTLIQPLGISAFTTLSWTTGHASMTIGAPLALLYALAPSHRGRPLLGRIGIPLTAIAGLIIAVAVHQDGQQSYGYTLSAGQILAVLSVVFVIGLSAFTSLGASLTTKSQANSPATGFLVTGTVAMKVAFDILPPTWAGFAVAAMILLVVGSSIYWLARHRYWGPREIGLLAAGAVIGGVLIGFASPVPAQANAASKFAQGSVFLAVAIAVLILVIRRTSRAVRTDVLLE